MSYLPAAFLLLDVVGKPGCPESVILPLGVVLLVCVVL
jgi:hypothetical protein